MMHQHVISGPDETIKDINSVICVFWDLEASCCALYQQMAAHERNSGRAEGWERLQNCRLLVGDTPSNHGVYLSQKLLSSCWDAIALRETDATPNSDPFLLMARIMQLKFLQVMLIAALRQQASVAAMIDVEKFDTVVAQVTHLVLSSRGC